MRPYKSRSEPAPRDDKKDAGQACTSGSPANSTRSTEEGKTKNNEKRATSACPPIGKPPHGGHSYFQVDMADLLRDFSRRNAQGHVIDDPPSTRGQQVRCLYFSSPFLRI